jgi:PPOX class probable F420-dependent enzyme
MAKISEVIPAGEERAFTVGDTTPGGLADLPVHHLALIDGPVTAALTTVGDNGRFQITPVWVGRDGDLVELNTVRGRLKDRNLRSNGRVALLFVDPDDAYHWMSIEGQVVEVIDEDDDERGHLATESIDSLSKLYINQHPYPYRDPAGGEVRVLFKVEPVKILTFGKS